MLGGQVRNQAHQPLPGVVVTLQGSKTLLTTNAAGEFLLPCEDVEPVLAFACAGYQTQTVRVKMRGPIAITLYKTGTLAQPPATGLELVAAPLSDFDEAPTFPGGAPAYQAYLKHNLHYPETALDKNITGTVLMKFVVDEQGHISDVEVAKSIAGLDEEATRLVRLMPWWVPARKKGQPVRAPFYLRINFALF